MPLRLPTSLLRLHPLRPTSTTSLLRHHHKRPLTTTPLFRAKEGGDYGTNPADPVASDPQSQGTSRTTRNKEHPGPESPVSNSSAGKEGKATSSGNFKDTRHDPSTQPKQPESEEVKRHNEEYSRRHDRPREESGGDEKVGKGWWKGERTG